MATDTTLLFKGLVMLTGKKNGFKCFFGTLLRGVLMCSLLLVYACSEGRKDKSVNDFVQAVEARPVQPVKPYPDVMLLPSFTYPVVQRRDPFAAYKTERSDNQVSGPDQARKKETLEVFPLDALQMVGVLRQGDKLWALMLAPDEIVYQVSIGNYMGQDYGRVVEVTPTAVQLLETIRVSGNWDERTQTLKLVERE